MAQVPPAQSSPPAVEIADLWANLPHGLGRRTILKGLQLRVLRGQTLGLLGPNGSGKSTLMRHLAGLLRPNQGHVLLHGRPAHEASNLTQVSYLPEDSPFPEDLSALQALSLLAALRGKKDPDALNAALERAGLQDHAKKRLGRFSRGMLRRFGLAQAFLFEPELVLLDEPSAGLDAPGLALLRDWICEHRERGGSLVLASHVVSELASHTDRLAILMDGHIISEGPTSATLGIEGRRTIELDELNDDVEERLRGWLEAQGARWVRSGPALRGAIEIYASSQRGHGH